MTPESRIKRAIKDLLDERGAFWSSVKGGAHSKIGDPDMVVCYKGRYIAVEAKTPTGVQSEWQKTRESEIRDAGGIYILARRVGDVEEVIDEIDEVD